MHKFLLTVSAFLIFKWVSSQVEQLSDLRFNPALYYSHINKQKPLTPSTKYLISGGDVVFTTDTLSLPFIDDFSSDRTLSYNWIPDHITDSFTNVMGGCLLTEGITTTSGTFISSPSWFYSYNYQLHIVDSFPQSPVSFTVFDTSLLSGCFSSNPSTVLYWPSYYTYTFDTSGIILDSTQVDDSTNPGRTIQTLTYAPKLYFATGQRGTLWVDNFAYINNTYPINPPTLGVATLDGLDQYGQPYNNSSTSAYGTADYLTSKPIDLSGLSEGDSIYLSFFYEPQGLGDYPDLDDSLIVEFRDNGGTWNQMWYDSGWSDPNAVPDTFTQVLIEMPTLQTSATFFYNTFQFRFRNKASLYGNNNHWHIDYVKLNQHRNVFDTIIPDIAFIYPYPTILKNFTLEPAKQFNYPADLADNITFTIRNNNPVAYTNPPSTPFRDSAYEIYPQPAVVYSPTGASFNATPTYLLQSTPSAYNISTSPPWPVDSLVIYSQIFINNTQDLFGNDTLLSHTQVFGSVMAYDDGSAEKAYGLAGGGDDIKKFAYEFDLNRPDTLTAFQVMFAQVEGDVSDLIFNFEAWTSSFQLNSVTYTDTPVLIIPNQTPFYIDSTNGFATYVLDSPLLVSSKILFGWAQTDTRRLQIGYDMNSPLGRQHMFIYTNGLWDTSSILPYGSPMIRLIFDSAFWGKSSNSVDIKEVKQTNDALTLFPNPSTGIVNIRNQIKAGTYQVWITDNLGQNVFYAPAIADRIDLSALTNGVYLFTAKDISSGKTYHSKIIKIAPN